MKSINRFFTLAGLITWAVLWTGCSNYENVSDMDAFTKDQAKMSFADLSANLKFVEFDRTYDAHHHGKDVHLSDILPQWNAAVMIEEANATLWEIPLISTYASVIVAGRLDGAYITPAEQPTQSRLLLRKDHATGEVECHMLTLVGENIAQTHINTLENLTGFAVISDPRGTPVQAYKITNGNREEILAGNAQLQHQDKDFYCFCFWKEMCGEVRTKMSVGSDIITRAGVDYCVICNAQLRFCQCKRCPSCGHTPPYCVCITCGICNEMKSLCQCNEECDRCHQPKWKCQCPPVVTPTCPKCGKPHDGPCNSGENPGRDSTGTTPPTTMQCPYGNPLCFGECHCCPMCRGVCKCPGCHRSPCICEDLPQTTR